MRLDRMVRDQLSSNLVPLLVEGEQVIWKRGAWYVRGTGTLGGTLFAATSGLVYRPDRLNRPARRSLVRIPFAEITAIGVQERSYGLSTSEVRRLLRIECRDRTAHQFVIEDPSEAAQTLQRLLDGVPEPPPVAEELFDAWMDLGRGPRR